jgi:predicted nucleic-acid-binding protein
VIALDTNVLVRYLAQDDQRQSALATRLIEKTLGPSNRGFVSLITLIETVWVMESRYGANAAVVAGILEDLADASSLQLQDAQAVKAAAQRYARGSVDLHDCLIVSLAAGRKAEVVTFDAKAAKRLGMQLLR